MLAPDHTAAMDLTDRARGAYGALLLSACRYVPPSCTSAGFERPFNNPRARTKAITVYRPPLRDVAVAVVIALLERHSVIGEHLVAHQQLR